MTDYGFRVESVNRFLTKSQLDYKEADIDFFFLDLKTLIFKLVIIID